MAAGLVSILAGSVLLITALPGGAATNQEEPSVPSTSVVDGNPTCADLGDFEEELKVEPVADGTFTDGTLTVTLDVRSTDSGPVFDWTSNIGVDAVFVKGGPGGTLYLYDPPAESTGDTGLHAPVNPTTGEYYGLSHVSFCYDADQTTTTTPEETTTTAPEETTTTTPEETTTTTMGETTTVPDETTTAPQGFEATTTPSTPTGELPRTGSTITPLLVAGAALLAVGLAVVAATRRLRNP